MRLARRFCFRKVMFGSLLSAWLVLFLLLTHYTDRETSSGKYFVLRNFNLVLICVFNVFKQVRENVLA